MAEPRKRKDRSERRREILQAACEVFSSKGYRLSSISDIIAKAGIARGTFYLYFDSKQDVFLKLIEYYFQEFARILRENHRHLEDTFQRKGNLFAAWRDNVANILRFHYENPSLTSIIYREAMGSDEDFSTRVEELSKLAMKIYLQEFKMMADKRLIRPCDVTLISSIVMGSTIYVIMEHLLRKKRVNVEDMAELIVEYHTRALAPPGYDVDRVKAELHRDEPERGKPERGKPERGKRGG
jgi:AcrR family transcriptional regulator